MERICQAGILLHIRMCATCKTKTSCEEVFLIYLNKIISSFIDSLDDSFSTIARGWSTEMETYLVRKTHLTAWRKQEA